ncbi:uncharacterized protein LOC134708181 [Mytilus trossulus]|uniref:uncharacterized protein LOC134708181 n=1 Tax=Mytilus trossulus TaxID=6551 RepID=UPI003007BEBE
MFKKENDLTKFFFDENDKLYVNMTEDINQSHDKMRLEGRELDNFVKDSQSQLEEPKSADMPREFLYETLKKVRNQNREEKERRKKETKRLKEVQKEREHYFANLEKDFRELQENYEKLLSERKENRLNLKEEPKGCTESSEDYVHLLQKRLQHNEIETTRIRYLLKEREDTIEKLRIEKDDLQTRLSSVAGEKLVKGNPSITDLGDPNRPIKIGEKYGELYDNEWTDAMECINDIKPFYRDSVHPNFEEILVLHLCRLLKSCYLECVLLAEEQMDKIGKTIAETLCLNISSREDICDLSLCKDVAIQRRLRQDYFANYLFKNQIIGKTAMNAWDYAYKSADVIELLMKTPFFEKCINLCWCMVIQDPIMYLDEDITQGTSIDKNTYKEFVKSGNKVNYVVWPALFLHKDGPLLYKGIVQAYWQ